MSWGIENCQMENWSPWQWSNPAEVCGNGIRTRKIVKEPKYGGKSCPETSKEEQTKPCDPGT